MSIFKQIPPTAGIPFNFRDFLDVLKPGGVKETLEDVLKRYLIVPQVSITSSGTAALFIILDTLKSFSHKRTVVIPAYVCPLVALSIARAGLKVEVCDVAVDSFDFDYLELEKICMANDDILAIIPVHLGGIPIDLESVMRIAQRYSITLIEDCAQSLGSLYRSRKVGTFGDFSFYSFARGKGLTIYEGGAIVVNNRAYLSQLLEREKALTKQDSFIEEFRKFELLGYYFFYNPALFWFVSRLPQIFWRSLRQPLKEYAEDFSIDFPIHRVSYFRKQCANGSFYKIGYHIHRQRLKAQTYASILKDCQGIKIITENPRDLSTYPYFTVIFEDINKKKTILSELTQAGLGASFIYAMPVCDYPYLKDIVPKREFPNARYISQHHMTLSTNIFLTPQDINQILSILVRNLPKQSFEIMR